MARVQPSDAYVFTKSTNDNQLRDKVVQDVPPGATPQHPSGNPSSLERVDEDLQSDTNWLDDVLEHSKHVLVETSPGIATLLNSDSSESLHHFRSALGDDVEVYLQTSLTYFHVPHTLLALRLRKTQNLPPCLQLRQLKSIIDRSLKTKDPNTLTMMWPLHNGRVVRALFALEGLAFAGKKVSLEEAASVRRSWSSCCFAIGAALGVSLGSWHCYLKVIQRQYGAAVAYSIARSFFFAQKLWILAVWSVLFGVILEQFERGSAERRILSAVMQVGVLAWGVMVAILGRNRNNILPAQSSSNTGEFMRPESLPNSDYRGSDGKRTRTIVLDTFVIPLTIFHFAFVIWAVYCMAQLLVHIVYIWGRCRDELKKDDNLEDCDATYWHGFNGFLATLATEVAIAILLIIFSEITKLIAWWLTSLRNLEKLLQKQYSQESIFIYMNIIERLIILTIICFVFTPQWMPPPANLSDIDCSGFLFGDSDMFCLQLHLSLETRQGIFKNIMVSAFVIEPFIEVLLKSVIPYLVMRLDRCARNLRCGCRACDCLVDGLAHLLALIFYFDCPKVGCIAYTWRGWPFQDLQAQVSEVGHHDQDDTQDSSSSADTSNSVVLDMLQQSVRREYEAIEEIKEIKLSFMWLLYFSFIYPYGVLAIVISRVLECQFDLAKLLLVCRRPFPEPDVLLHWTQVSFYVSAVCGAFGWNIGLFMLTYNEDLPMWSESARWGAAITLSVWQLLCMALMLTPLPSLK